ncbi:MAG TPA: outer membrane lipoprotein-sorting protein [Terracidiphilus sp.]|nr:outer membrane lipoprotein-sorting protein [Terracidiphilus sp.]
MRGLAVLAALALLVPCAVHAVETHTPLDMARERVKTADYRVTGRLVHVEAGGARISYGVALKAHWFGSELRVLLEITSPAAARERILLTMHPEGHDSIEIAKPGAGAASLPFARWSDGILGGDFSYEDFLEPQFFWPVQSLLREEKRGARDCDVVKSTPGAADRTHYAEEITWLDRTIGFPIYAEKTLKGSGAVRQFTYYGLRHDGGVWSANQIEAAAKGKAGSTLLIIERGSAQAHLTAKDFSPDALTHFNGGQ